jgi:hypothetical protein
MISRDLSAQRDGALRLQCIHSSDTLLQCPINSFSEKENQ